MQTRRELTLQLAALAAGISGLSLNAGGARANAPAGRPDEYAPDEIVANGHRFFGSISRGLAELVEKATKQWGRPNGYILGQEATGAFFGGLRYGEGVMHTRNAGDLRVFWQGPSLGLDAGADGDRTMMLVYNLPATDAIYRRYGGVDGSAYIIGGLGMTALVNDGVYVVPIRSGVGARLGFNVSYLKFTQASTWNPF
ncbi:DUF1134 domain-containing protein [Methylocapsa acidiphila]|uniref:DUF1134 domain-containing protein n=1 Tax=Methylocapsa acidiphila TaxID=133552 RepID=UPI00041CD100|nr:DUF1134 domain-containing protein [Methylocapsa acidiphila]